MRGMGKRREVRIAGKLMCKMQGNCAGEFLRVGGKKRVEIAGQLQYNFSTSLSPFVSTMKIEMSKWVTTASVSVCIKFYP
jgi:hypothetical protein